MDDAGWRDAELWAPQADVPVEIDVSRRGEPGSLLDEIAEFQEESEEADEHMPGAIKKGCRHLAATDATVAVPVLGSDARHGPRVGNCVLEWYAQRDDVLLQVDADGFYDGDELLVTM